MPLIRRQALSGSIPIGPPRCREHGIDIDEGRVPYILNPETSVIHTSSCTQSLKEADGSAGFHRGFTISMEARAVGYLLIRNTRCVEALSPASVVPERLTRKRVPFDPLNVSKPCDALSLWLERLPLPMGCQAIFVPDTPDVCHRTLT